MVAAAAALDLFDGAAARRRGAEGEFGANLDSLADLVSFGVAPAFALYLSAPGVPSTTGVFVGIACALFVVCGALRLARFPLVKSRNHFVGLPIPPAGVAVVLLAALAVPSLVSAILAFMLAVLMVGKVRFPTPATMLALLVRRPPREVPQDGLPEGDTESA